MIPVITIYSLAFISQAGRETPYMHKSRCRYTRTYSYTQGI